MRQDDCEHDDNRDKIVSRPTNQPKKRQPNNHLHAIIFACIYLQHGATYIQTRLCTHVVAVDNVANDSAALTVACCVYECDVAWCALYVLAMCSVCLFTDASLDVATWQSPGVQVVVCHNVHNCCCETQGLVASLLTSITCRLWRCIGCGPAHPSLYHSCCCCICCWRRAHPHRVTYPCWFKSRQPKTNNTHTLAQLNNECEDNVHALLSWIRCLLLLPICRVHFISHCCVCVCACCVGMRALSAGAWRLCACVYLVAAHPWESL